MASLRGYPLDWWPVDPIHVDATTTDQLVISREGRLFGWAFEETTGAAGAQCSLQDGSSLSGKDIVPITLLANESTRDVFGRPGIRVQAGVWLHVLSGSVRATVYFLGLTEDEIIRQAGYQVQ